MRIRSRSPTGQIHRQKRRGRKGRIARSPIGNKSQGQTCPAVRASGLNLASGKMPESASTRMTRRERMRKPEWMRILRFLWGESGAGLGKSDAIGLEAFAEFFDRNCSRSRARLGG